MLACNVLSVVRICSHTLVHNVTMDSVCHTTMIAPKSSRIQPHASCKALFGAYCAVVKMTVILTSPANIQTVL